MSWGPLRLAPDRPPVMSGISAEEVFYLSHQAQGRRVLEIGSAYGASTIAMALGALEVTSVDPHGFVPLSREWLEINLGAYGVESKVRRIEESSLLALPRLYAAGERFDVAFVDGDHRTAAVTADAHNAHRLASLLIFHDYGNPEEPEVAPVVDSLFADYRRERGPGWLMSVWV